MAVGSAVVAAISICMYAEYAGHGPPGALRRSLAGTRRRPLPSAYPIAPVPALSRPILQVLEHSRGPLLEVPVGRGLPWPPFHAAAMYRSIYHRRPILNGYSSYWPAGWPERGLRRLGLCVPRLGFRRLSPNHADSRQGGPHVAIP